MLNGKKIADSNAMEKLMNENIITIAEEFNKIGAGFGNDILYNMCDCSVPYNVNHLSSKIWLIGRSYAASPERRYYGKSKKEFYDAEHKNAKTLHTLKTSNDGVGSFFDVIAEYMVNGFLQESYKELVNELQKLKNYKYRFDYSKEDQLLLIRVVGCVSLLNKIIRTASEEFDGVIEKVNRYGEKIRCKNQISFCSKFLHFHCRELVFIIDQYSNNGSYSIFNYSGKKHISFNNIKLEQIDINDFRRQTANKGFDEFVICSLDEADDNTQLDNIDKIKNYAEHLLRSYKLGCFLKNNGVEANPRLIDSLLLQIKRS